MRQRLLLGALATVGFVALSLNAMAQVPPTLSLQGDLTNAQAGLSTSPSITFRLYSSASGGTALWTETQTVNLIPNGQYKHFSVILGNTTSLNGIAFDQQYWVGLSVGGGAEITPRYQLPISPYAVRSHYADSVLNGLADGSVTLPKISNTGATNGQVIGYDGTNITWTTPSSGLTLPYSQTANAASPLLDISQTGASNVGSFVINNSGSVASVLNLNHNGIGNGLAIQLSNASNGGRGVDVTQSGVGPGVFATSAGGNAVWGITSSISAAGVIGDNTFGEAVVGRNRGGNGVGAVVGRNDSSGYGVRGFNTKNGYGVLGQAGISGGTGTAGRFENVNAANTSDALQVVTNSSGNAARFTGNVVVNGNLTVSGTVAKGGGSFMIDHPLDPQNKILYHSFVESPDMMNIYNGVTVLDGNGEAAVQLPDWFMALNGDYRYQLTAIGAPGPNLYIAEEIKENHFKIAGGKPGMKVSWEVTGIRHDPYAVKHPIVVEVEKSADQRGTYLQPDAYGVETKPVLTTTSEENVPQLESAQPQKSPVKLPTVSDPSTKAPTRSAQPSNGASLQR